MKKIQIKIKYSSTDFFNIFNFDDDESDSEMSKTKKEK